MLKVLGARYRQKYRTVTFPQSTPVLPARFKGLPAIDPQKCLMCGQCISVCPVEAIACKQNKIVGIDLGKCLFCGQCSSRCPQGALSFSSDYRLSVSTKEDLLCTQEGIHLAKALSVKTKVLFGRSLKLRQVSAGGCNACELDTNVLNTVVFDLGRFGIQFVASPRHADGLFITGPVTKNMELALKKTYDAVASPKIVIAAGACAIAGGPYRDHAVVHNGVYPLLPVDLYIPGCPPHPFTILDGLLRLLDRL